MNRIHYLGIFALCSLSCACSAGGSEPSNSGIAAEPLASAATATPPSHAVKAASLKLPANFTSYASESIGKNILCHVGAVTGDDGMNQKPIAYAETVQSKQVLWVAQLNLPPDTFQSRATHCTSSGDTTFVLLQSDTQSEQTLSQTLLRVVKLDTQTGTLQTQRNVDVPKAYSAWVNEGASHFQWQGNALVVSGNYRLSSDNDNQAQFTVHLNSNLNP